MKREKSYVDNRRKRILEIMKENPQVRVDELAVLLNVSLITIRRDLQYLEDQKQLIRVYGGAVSIPEKEEGENEVQVYRKLIAQFAAKMVSDNDTIFINTSANALKMLEYVDSRLKVTAITNNGKAITSDFAPGVDVILTGGELRHPKEAMVGDFALRNLHNIYVKKAFMGCSGISAENGMTTEIFNEVSINELMIDHATQEVYLLADHTKIGSNSSFVSCAIEKIHCLITDELAPEEALERIRAKGVAVYKVGREQH